MTLIGKIELHVEDSEIDELGHVNNARFLEYFERGRMDWYNRCDPTLNNVTGKHLGTVVVNIDVNYRQECFSGARLVIETRPGTRGRKSYVLHQAIFNGDGAGVCDARVTSVVMDMSTRETTALPPSLAEQFSKREQSETP
jgi:YbgC/YbaW family acyl-CoA thioester hydrolase